MPKIILKMVKTQRYGKIYKYSLVMGWCCKLKSYNCIKSKSRSCSNYYKFLIFNNKDKKYNV
jgi:hypothetical protein